MRYILGPGNTLIVRGPASLQLRSGETTVLAAPVENRQKIVVGRERQLPFEARSEVDLEIQLGVSGEVFEVEGSTIPRSWVAAADAIATMGQGRVLVIGGADVGKSTLCVYLTNTLLSMERKVRIIDGDIGQADLGPPTAIGSAPASSYIPSLVDLKPDALIFIGHTSPSQVEMKLIAGIQRLVKASQEELTIINTDGWIQDSHAILYKIELISAIDPDLILGISIGPELDPILAGSRTKSMHVEAPSEVLSRSRSDRRELRVAGYRRYLNGASTNAIPLNSIRVRVPKGLPPLQRFPRQELRNLIVGLSNNEDYLLGIGVLIDFHGDSLRIYSRVFEGMSTIELGFVKLSTDGSELGYITL